MSGQSPAGAAMGKKGTIQRRSRGPAPSEVGDKLVLRHHKRQACFLRPEDVSCKRLLLWKPGCWGGGQAGGLYIQLSFTLRWREAVTSSIAQKTYANRDAGLWDRWVHGPGRNRACRTRASKSNTTQPPGPTNVPWPAEDKSNTVVDCCWNSCAAAYTAKCKMPARCLQECAGSWAEQT